MATNNITGATLQTKASTPAFRSGWELIFGKNKTAQEAQAATIPESDLKTELESNQVINPNNIKDSP